MTTSRVQRVADPRQSPFDRAMHGVHWITPGQRQQIIASAQKRYKEALRKRQAAMKAREAAARRARR
jgi:hypothetical protein